MIYVRVGVGPQNVVQARVGVGEKRARGVGVGDLWLPNDSIVSSIFHWPQSKTEAQAARDLTLAVISSCKHDEHE
jgi:hypothetical protein